MDLRLDPGIDRARGVVEDQDSRVAQQRPGQGDALALATRQGEAAFAYHGAVTLGQVADEAVGLGGACRRLHLGIAGVGAGIGNVRPHGVGEEKALFEHHSDLAPEACQGDITDVHPVYAYRSLLYIVEPRQEQGHGRLARSRCADQGDRLARVYLEVKTVQHRLAAQIPETNALKGDPAAYRGQRLGVGAIADYGVGRQQIEHPLGSRPRLLSNDQHSGEHPGRRRQL